MSAKANYGIFDIETYRDDIENGALGVGGDRTMWSLVGDAFTGLWNDITGKSQQYQEYQQQIDLMNMQNEYNNPVNQMERLRAAGINPNLAAGGVAKNGNISASPSSVNSAVGGVQGAMSWLGDSLMNILNFGLARKKNEADIKVANATAENLTTTTEGLAIDNAWKDKLNAAAVDKMQKEIDKLVEDRRISKYTGDILRSDSQFQDLKNMQDVMLRIQQYKDYIEKWRNMRHQWSLWKAQEDLAKANEGLVNEQTRTQEWQTKIGQWRYVIAEKTGLDPMSNGLDSFLLSASDEEQDRLIDGMEKVSSAGVQGQKELEEKKTEESWERPIILNEGDSQSEGLNFQGSGKVGPLGFSGGVGANNSSSKKRSFVSNPRHGKRREHGYSGRW